MNDTIVVTSIYSEFWGTEQFRKSCARIGLPVHNAFKGTHFTGNGDAMRMIYEAYIELKDKYEYAIYSDGADTFFTKTFEPPKGVIIYSAEKAVWPPVEELRNKYNDFYEKHLHILSPWKYLNAGNCCGPIPLLIEFYERYGLNKHDSNVNGQWQIAEALLKACDEDFPIYLDIECKYFQTTGFEYPGDFSLDEQSLGIINNITGSRPSVLHGNGRTDMTPIYKRYNL